VEVQELEHQDQQLEVEVLEVVLPMVKRQVHQLRVQVAPDTETQVQTALEDLTAVVAVPELQVQELLAAMVQISGHHGPVLHQQAFQVITPVVAVRFKMETVAHFQAVRVVEVQVE
jgi:short-subunit dehydrogenase involved in D-alanine esterification of teichoic acids